MKFPIFVYGTLKKGERAHIFLKDAQFLGRAFVAGFELYDLGEYPGAKRGKGIVKGEVYLVDKNLLKLLDEYEEEGKEYRRICVKAKMEDGRSIEAWFYEYLGPVKKNQLIPSGEWKGSFKKRKRG